MPVGALLGRSNFGSDAQNAEHVPTSVVVIPFFSELELELYLLRKEAELELAVLNQHLELAPPLESVPLLELAPGIQCLGHSN